LAGTFNAIYLQFSMVEFFWPILYTGQVSVSPIEQRPYLALSATKARPRFTWQRRTWIRFLSRRSGEAARALLR